MAGSVKDVLAYPHFFRTLKELSGHVLGDYTSLNPLHCLPMHVQTNLN